MSLISLIIPVYFNAPTLPALAHRLANLASHLPQHEFEFIYVDDGSQDNSFEVLSDLACQYPCLRVIKLTRNFGSNIAIFAGMSAARGDCVGFLAADLQDPPETFIEIISAWERGSPVVLAVRRDRQGDPWATRLTATIFNWLFTHLVYKDISPQGVGFFLIDRKVIDVLLQCEEKNTHLIGLVLWTGFPSVSIYYERIERIEGKSRWTFRKKLKYFIDAFVAFSYLPLRLTSYLGLLFALLGGLYAVVIVILRLLNDIPVQGWTALAVITLILSGVQLLMLGVIGEYLWRNFDASRKRPLYLVDRVIESKKENG